MTPQLPVWTMRSLIRCGAVLAVLFAGASGHPVKAGGVPSVSSEVGVAEQEEEPEAADPLAGLRQSLAGQAALGIAAEKRVLEERWVSEAERAAIKKDGRASALSWRPTYEHLGKWGRLSRRVAESKGVHCVLVVQSLSIKKGGKITTNFRPIGGGNSRPVKYQGARVAMKFRLDVFDPHQGRWSSAGRWEVEEDRTAVPATVNLTKADKGLVQLDSGELIVDMLEPEMRAQAKSALRASLALPDDRPSNWVFLLTPNEERELWRRLAEVRFGQCSYRLESQSLLPAREFGEQALARLEEPGASAKASGLRQRAAKFLRPLLVHFRDGAGSAWPQSMSIPTTVDAAGFRALFDAGLVSLDSPEGVRFDPSKKEAKQSKGRRKFDLVIHEDAMAPGLLSSLPCAGVLRSYLVTVGDGDIAGAPEEWGRVLKGLTGAAIVERKRGKLVRSAQLSRRDVTSEALVQLLRAKY